MNAASIRKQYAANLVGLREMLEKARAVAPRKHRGYDVATLEDRVALFARLATASDDEIIAHLRNTRAALRSALTPNGRN